MTDVTYTTGQLARIAGISAVRLIRWDREGVLRPTHRHARGLVEDRGYTQEQALGIMALGELHRGGVGDRDLRRAAALMPESITAHKYLVFVGHKFCARSEPLEVFELLSSRSGRVILVEHLLQEFQRHTTGSVSDN